jgi:GT2 family glycosyltransferase
MSLEDEPFCPKISILICSKERRSDLERMAGDLRKMNSHHPYEIVVAEETDEPRPIEGVRYFPHPVKNLGFPYARNLSIEKSTGEILVFVDDDCQIQDAWLEKLIRPFHDPSVVGVQGGVTIPDGSNAVGWAESILGFPGGGIRRIIHSFGQVQDTIEVSTLNCAYRRWVLETVGGFNGRLKWGGEDYLLAKKACQHGKCLFVPYALVAHRPRGDVRSIFQWFVRRGRADIGVIGSREYAGANWGSLLRSSLTLKWIVISMFFLFAPGGLAYMVPAFFLLYFFMQYCRSFSIWRKSKAPFKSFVILPFVKLIMDFAADVGRLKGILYG